MAESDDAGDGPEQRPDAWLPPQSAPRPAESRPSGPSPSGPSPSGPPPILPPTTVPPWAYRPAALPGPSRVRPGLLVLAVVVPLAFLLVFLGAVGSLFGRSGSLGSSQPRPSRAPTSSLPTSEATVVWSVEPGRLRPDLPGAVFISSVDGAFQQNHVVQEAGSWLTITGTEGASDTVLHALDPNTGNLRWQRPLEGVLCTTEAPSSGLLCASVLTRDPTTGLGTRWRLHLLDPATGVDRLSRDIDGWLTAVHLSGNSFVLLEQRQPAPHAVVQSYAADDLRPQWTQDLSTRTGQAEMFSTDRIVQRPEPKRPGLALDRPRLRDVGNGLVAVWAGQRTAFIDPRSGKLVMMPHCSRLVDDGSRLWCNEVDGASAYRYDGRALFRIRGPRLAFPTDDGVGADRSRPVFLNDDGAGVSVDPATGKVGAVFTPPGRGSAFGMVTMPGTYVAGGSTYLVGKAGTMLIDAKRDRVVWRNTAITAGDVPIPLGDRLLLGSYRLTVVDPKTGVASAVVRTGATYTQAIGGRIAGVGSDRVSLLRIP